MGQLEDALEKRCDLEGFLAAGIFSPEGERIAGFNGELALLLAQGKMTAIRFIVA